MMNLQEFASGNIVGVLLQELSVTDAVPEVIKDTGTVVTFSTVLQDDKPNRNKRYYSKEVLSEGVSSPRIKELLRTRTLFGEANHPFVDDLKRQMVIDHTRISHLITEITTNNGQVNGKIETAATSVGRDMRGLIVENRSTVAFSMRGMGSVRKVPEKDLLEVVKPLAIYTWDWVQFPSHAAAYMSGSTVKNEGYTTVTKSAATEYAINQSRNVQSLIEQFELEDPEFSLTEDQKAIMIRSGTTIVKSFLEKNIRSEFRSLMSRL
jgi:hypothetical protein